MSIDTRHVDKQGYSYMHTAAKYGTGDMARLLLFYGALRDPETEHFKNHPAHLAVMGKNLDVLKVLLFEYGADPDVRSINNLKPDQLAQDNKAIRKMFAEARELKTSSNDMRSQLDVYLP